MNISHRYFLVATLFLFVGLGLGMYMGASGDHTLIPVHAHLNLLGFTLLMIFGLVFRAVPAMGTSGLARVQLWLHISGVVLLLGLLTLYLLGRVPESMMALSVIGEIAIVAGLVLFLVNLVRNGAAEQPARTAALAAG